LSEANGFQIDQVLACETNVEAKKRWQMGRWFLVNDPLVLRERISLVNRRETYLLISAKRLARKPILASPVQQSDYENRWRQAGQPSFETPAAVPVSAFVRFRRRVPTVFKLPVRMIRRLHGRILPALNSARRYVCPFDPKYFKRLHTP
jgi:hypothetical protein